MAKHTNIIEISIKAHIKIEGDMQHHISILQAVAAAHQSGDYTAVIALAKIDEVKSEQKRRRFADPEPATQTAETAAEPAEGAEETHSSAPVAELEPAKATRRHLATASATRAADDATFE